MKSYLRPIYQNSHAICIGIDDYLNWPTLGCAGSDAIAVRDAIVKNLGFKLENVQLLLNSDASRAGILKAIYALSEDMGLSGDDRLIIFFAGHGDTRSSYKGQRGYLVPCEADIHDISTLISWTSLVDACDHVLAKHVLFVIDACYSGLAIEPLKRSGTHRYITDLLTRPARQVIASGMHDQEVADAGGSRPGHSIFAGAFLDVLERETLSDQEVVTATQMMAHLKRVVGTASGSSQTPHFGQIGGQGDMVLFAPDSSQGARPINVEVEYSDYEIRSGRDKYQTVKLVKECIPIKEKQIELYELVVEEAREFITNFKEEFEAIKTGDWKNETAQNIVSLAAISEKICAVASCLGFWCENEHLATIRKLFQELTSSYIPTSGSTYLIAMAKYPLYLAIKSFGVSALAAGKHQLFSNVLSKEYPWGSLNEMLQLSVISGRCFSDIGSHEVIKHIKEYERNHFPLSEIAFSTLQPILNDTIYLQEDYETATFEYELAMYFAFYVWRFEGPNHEWGPPGRFLYRERHGNQGPLKLAMDQYSKTTIEKWWPVRTGLIPLNKSAIEGGFQALDSMSNKYW